MFSSSYSSRNSKGTHRGNERAGMFLCKVTENWTRQAWVLKCDIRKFFDSIDHEILISLIRANMPNEDIMKLVETTILSFEKSSGQGLPLGNVTSQLFSNIYMNEFDQFAKHSLKAKYYVRYCDDFVIVDRNKKALDRYIPEVKKFLLDKLKLELHPDKVSIRKARQGIDFLGYVVLPHRRVVRTNTKRRIIKNMVQSQKELKTCVMTKEKFEQKMASYRGVLSHGRNKRVEMFVDNIINNKT